MDQTFLEIVRSHLRYLPPHQELRGEVSLRRLGLDSMESVSLLLDLEEAFGVTLPDDSLTAETFATAGNLFAAVRHARSPGQTGPGEAGDRDGTARAGAGE